MATREFVSMLHVILQCTENEEGMEAFVPGEDQQNNRICGILSKAAMEEARARQRNSET